KSIRKVIEQDLGEKLQDAFAEFDEEPIAAASIGQVHRAQLDDGRDVAVKVQYPGIAEAIQADMQNLRLALKLLSVIAPGIDTGPRPARLLNADPHPGNSLFGADGQVAFLDFGFSKTMSQEEVDQLMASTRATYEHDAQALFKVIAPLGQLPDDPALAEPFYE